MIITVHKVKCWPAYFDAIASGAKPFDVRRDDRGYQRGDIIVLQRTREDRLAEVDCMLIGHEWVPKRELRREITYVLTGGQFGIQAGYVVLGLREIVDKPATQELVDTMLTLDEVAGVAAHLAETFGRRVEIVTHRCEPSIERGGNHAPYDHVVLEIQLPEQQEGWRWGRSALVIPHSTIKADRDLAILIMQEGAERRFRDLVDRMPKVKA